MQPKAFTDEARDAIRAQAGPLFEAIVNAYLAGNPDEVDEDEADEEERVSHVPGLLRNLAEPFLVHLVYVLYATELPEYVTAQGKRVRILEPEDRAEDRMRIFRSFNLLFDGQDGWNEHAKKYAALGHDRKKLELLAVKWLEGGLDNAEFIRECEKVPGFAEQLSAVCVDEEGQFPGASEMLHLAGYRRMRAQYAAEGGNPEDLDKLVLASMSGDEQAYQAMRQKLAGVPKPSGCASAILILLGLLGAVLGVGASVF